MTRTGLRAAAIVAVLSPIVGHAGELRVAATIPPVHSLVAQVMAGAGEPELVVAPGASPHGHALRPSDAAVLSRADVVFWIGEGLEPWLAGPLDALAGDAAVLALAEVPGLVVLGRRRGGLWEEHAQEAGDGSDEHAHDGGNGPGEEHAQEAGAAPDADPHLWLDPVNAAAWLDAIAAALAGADPDNAALYRANAAAARAGLDDLTRRVAARAAALDRRNFIVFHDAYQYFEARFGLPAAGSVTVDGEQVGAARLAAIRARVAELDAACIFTEPQFPPRLAETIARGTGARIGVLDPVGAGLEPGAALYPALIEGLIGGLEDCLD